MTDQNRDPSKRVAQHILAQEIVELAHGAAEAKKAAMAHKDAFGQGTNTFSLLSLRKAISNVKGADTTAETRTEPLSETEKNLLAYKKAFAASATAQPAQSTTAVTTAADEPPQPDTNKNVITLPLSMLHAGSFPHVLHAVGLASSKSEASRLIASKGAYVLVPNSGPPENPTALRWETIKPNKDCDPNHYLVDFVALVLRAGKSKIQICRVVKDEADGAKGLLQSKVEVHRQ